MTRFEALAAAATDAQNDLRHVHAKWRNRTVSRPVFLAAMDNARNALDKFIRYCEANGLEAHHTVEAILRGER